MLLNEMEIFYYVVEQQSFSKAAERLKVSKSFISKRLSRLEQELNVRLLYRNTRKLKLTEAGEDFYHHCSSIVKEGQKGYSRMTELQGTLAGSLKISVPPTIALHLISPVITKFLEEHPKVTLNVKLESNLIDLIKDGYDLALRSAMLESSNLTAQKIFTIKPVVCATKKYLQKHGKLSDLTDLTSDKHNCAVYSESKSANYIKFVKQQSEETVKIKGNLMSNQLELIKQLVLQDLCIGILPEFMVTKELKNKSLIQCLPDYKIKTSNLYAIYPDKKFMLPILKQFLSILKKHFKSF